MNQWAYVIAAFGVTLAGTGGLIAWAHAGMRRAEAAVDRLRERR